MAARGEGDEHQLDDASCPTTVAAMAFRSFAAASEALSRSARLEEAAGGRARALSVTVGAECLALLPPQG